MSEGDKKEIHEIVQSLFAKDAWTEHWEPDHLGGSNVREKLKRVLELSTPSPQAHLEPLSKEESDLLQAFRDGKAIVCRANFGLATRSYPLENGRYKIEVDQSPPSTPRTLALNKFMRETIRAWQEILGDTPPQPREAGSE